MGFAFTLVHAHGCLIAQKIGMMSRIMMTAAIYKKVISTYALSVHIIYNSPGVISESGDYWTDIHWTYCESSLQ